MDSTSSKSNTTSSGVSSEASRKSSTQGFHHVTHPLPQLAHHEILKTFDEADSLLQILSERKYSPSVKENKVNQLPVEVASYQQKPVFTIRPKSDADVIEELQIVNSNLRNLVDRVCILFFIQYFILFGYVKS